MDLKTEYTKEKTKVSNNQVENKSETKRFFPKNLFELEKAIQEYKTISYYDVKTDPNLQDRKNFLKSYISRGIPVQELPLKDIVINNIYKFLSGFGYSKEFIIDQLNNLEVYTTDMEVAVKEDALGIRELKRIGIDYSYFEFDKNTGECIGIKKEDDFLIHIITHEFFHSLSSLQKISHGMLTQDVFSEGFTDLFAMMVNGNYDQGSNTYNFSARVCTLFAGIMGMDKVLEDYVNDLVTLPNMAGLCKECGVSREEFFEIRRLLSSTISEFSLEDEDILNRQKECLEVLKSEIVLPYCQNHPQEADRIMLFFEELFKDYFAKFGKSI